MSFFGYWGKAGKQATGVHLLPYHGLDVAAVGDVLLRRDDRLRRRIADCACLPDDVFLGLVRFFLAVHDLGKFSYKFQEMNSEAMRLLGRDPVGMVVPSERHDRLGWRFWDESLGAIVRAGRLGGGSGRTWLRFWRGWGRAFLGHHGTPPDIAVSIAERPVAEDFGPADQQAAEAYLAETAELFELPRLLAEIREVAPGMEEGPIGRCSWFLAGLAILCDWLGSSTSYFPPEIRPVSLAVYWRERALPLAERALVASGVLPNPVRDIAEPEHLLPHLAGQDLSPLQRAAWEAGQTPGGPRLLIFEDLTGSGKTEAAILAAFGLMRQGLAEGIFFALPTQATSNAMYPRIAAVYPRLFATGSQPSLVLAHGSRELSETFLSSIEGGIGEAYDSAEDGRAWCAAWLADHRKRALLASVGVGTLDQALLGVLPSRHQAIRLLGTGRSVLVVDEVHAYDEYVTGLLKTLLQFQAAQGGSAILLSATLPRALRQSLAAAYADGLQEVFPGPLSCQSIAFPLATCLQRAGLEERALPARKGTHRRTEVVFASSDGEVVKMVEAAIESNGCVLWVRNTVADAVAAYEQLVGRYGEDRVMLFHARFALCDRAEHEAEILERFGPGSATAARQARIVVATQVAEQSLDVDFDFVVSDLAPIESLIQRAGRCMRHPRADRPRAFTSPRLVILAPPWDVPVTADWYAALSRGAARVYPFHGHLWLGAAWLREHGLFRLPEDARTMLEFVYGEGAEARVPPALRKHDKKAGEDADLAASWARHNALDLAAGYTADVNPWQDDENARTRLGEPTVTLRLCRVAADRLVPWDESGPKRLRWPRSDVSVRRARCARIEADWVQQSWMAAARDDMPDSGRWTQTLPLRADEKQRWVGRGWTSSGTPVVIYYSRKRGLWFDNR